MPHARTRESTRTLLADCPCPLILDSQDISPFADKAAEFAEHKSPPLALTGHPGEMAHLLGSAIAHAKSNRLGVSRETAAQCRAHVILKGYHTVVTRPDGRAYVNTTGNPGMATSGSGAVLTGILAGLTAQFGAKNWERILGLGVYLHGLAGDLAAAQVGEAPLIASDVLASVPAAWRQVYSDIEGTA